VTADFAAYATLHYDQTSQVAVVQWFDWLIARPAADQPPPG